MDDLVMAGDHNSNSDAMDIDPSPENGFEDITDKKLESPCSSVSTHCFPPSLFPTFFFNLLGNL